MKLVDILARELRVWPFEATHAYSSGHLARFSSAQGNSVKDFLDIGQEPEDQMTAFVTRAQWQAAVDALKADKVVEWNGEGLPPVGTVCEYRGVHQFDAWSEVKIFAEWGRGSSKVVFFDFGDGWREERSPDRFRAVRTQVQMEEMRLSVKEMCAVALTTPVVTCDQAEIIMRRLYDAGYRKFEIVDN